VTLSVETLRQALTQFFSNPGRVPTAARAEELWAESYHTYAREAQDVSGDVPQNLDPEKFLRELDFLNSRSAMQFAEQLDRAFVSYWSGVTFATGLLPPGSPPCPNAGGSGTFGSEVASAVYNIEAGAMLRALLPVLSGGFGSAQAQASRFATVMDRVTKTSVRVLIVGQDTTPPPTGPFPITNNCTVF
jgi:hypothetical protein